VLYRLLFIFIISTTFICAGLSQDIPGTVKRSTDKILLEGRIYYIHVVKEGEALEAISLAYGISEKNIALENPDVFQGLEVGMVLKIPADPIHAEEITIQSTDDFHYHVIGEGETLYFLSKKYSVPVEIIEQYNPEVEYSDLQINQVIKIPKIKAEQEGRFSTEDYYYHYVQKGETLYSLSVYYGVNVDEIKALNPELQWGDLKYDEYIKIPRKEEVAEGDSVRHVPEAEGTDTTLVWRDTTLTFFDTIGWHDTTFTYDDTSGWHAYFEMMKDSIDTIPTVELNVGLFLPLLLHWDEYLDTAQVDEEEELALTDLQKEKEEEERPPFNPRIIGYLDFYQGALLALDSLRNKGISINLNVYDTERNPEILEGILNMDEISQLNLMIGPVNELNLDRLAEYGLEHKIPVVSPFTACNERLRYNPFLIQLFPSREVAFKGWANYLADYHNETIILVYSGDSTELDQVNYLKQELFEKLAYQTYLSEVSLKEAIINDTTTFDLAHILTQDRRNIVVIPSDNEAYVGNILTSMYFLSEQYEIRIFGLPNWPKFKSIDLKYLHELDVHYYTAFYVDYSRPDVMDFIRKYREVFQTEPFHVTPSGYNLSLYGYDIFNYFCTLVSEEGNGFVFQDSSPDYIPLLGPYDLQRTRKYDGLMNYHINLIHFTKDFNIEVVPEPKLY
jgi:LysM repeat protein